MRADSLTANSCLQDELQPRRIQRYVEGRLGYGQVLVGVSARWGYTIWHRFWCDARGEYMDAPIAQLRPADEQFKLFWMRPNGRWWPYAYEGPGPVMRPLALCLEEISQDPHGCFWR